MLVKPIDIVYEAKQLTIHNLEQIGWWTEGKICGTKLSKKDQVVEIGESNADQIQYRFTAELKAEIGDWILRNRKGKFIVVSEEYFNANFAEWGFENAKIKQNREEKEKKDLEMDIALEFLNSENNKTIQRMD